VVFDFDTLTDRARLGDESYRRGLRHLVVRGQPLSDGVLDLGGGPAGGAPARCRGLRLGDFFCSVPLYSWPIYLERARPRS